MGAVHLSGNDIRLRSSYFRNMGRKSVDTPSSAPPWDWFLNEWMASTGVNQTTLRDRAGWSKASASNICSGKTGYSKRLVNEAANALNIQPYELLMHPDDAMAIRQLRKDALTVVEHGRRLEDAGPNVVRMAGAGK